MTKDNTIYVKHILEEITDIENFIKNSTEKNFTANPMMQKAVIRSIEIIGEAARNISPSFQNKHPQIPWRKITGMRNKLIHDYFEIDLALVWQVANKNLPFLKKQFLKLLKNKHDLTDAKETDKAKKEPTIKLDTYLKNR